MAVASISLPPARTPGSYRIAVVCLGNICRSPMAHVVLEDRVAAAGLDGVVTVVSSGTGGWHVGNPMDRRAAATLTASGYDAGAHRAEQFDASWFDACDLVLAMDGSNRDDLLTVGTREDAARVAMFRDFDPRAGHDRDVADPYYGGDDGFEVVLATVERTADALVAALADALAGDGER